MVDLVSEITRRIERMTLLSPSVYNCVNGEQWRTVLDADDVDEEALQQEAYLCLIEDLSIIGINIRTSVEVLYGRNEQFNAMLDVLEWVLPNGFYPKLKKMPDLVAAVETLLTVIGDHDDLVLGYLDMLANGEWSGFQQNLLPGVEFIRENVYGTIMFQEYLITLLRSVHTALDQTPILPDNPGLYHATMHELAHRLTDGIHLLDTQSGLSDDDHNFLHRRVLLTVQTIMRPDVINIWGWVLTTDPNRLDPLDQTTYRHLQTESLNSIKMTPQWYQSREQTASLRDGLSMLSWGWARRLPLSPSSDYWTQIMTVLDPNVVDTFTAYAQAFTTSSEDPHESN